MPANISHLLPWCPSGDALAMSVRILGFLHEPSLLPRKTLRTGRVGSRWHGDDCLKAHLSSVFARRKETYGRMKIVFVPGATPYGALS
jgi:hypothetical protein